MRIVDVCAFYTPMGGGVRTYVEQKMALAPDLGHDVTILAPGECDGCIVRNDHARIVTIRAPRLLLDRRYHYFDSEPALHRTLDLLRPDFVEVSSPWQSPVMAARWNRSVPKSLIMHADPLSAYAYRWLGGVMPKDSIDARFDWFWRHLRRLGEAYDTVICANLDLHNRMTTGGIANARLLPMGVEEGIFSFSRRNLTLRRELLSHCDLDEDATLLIAAGRLAPEKRLPMLAGAAARAGRRRSIGLVIFGDGREKASLLRAIGGNPHIRVMKPVRDRLHFATLLASCDALVHGCESETFCMTAAEARASGIPVIVPDAGGAAEFAVNGGGYRYRAADGDDLVRVLLSLPLAQPQAAPVQRIRTMRDHFEQLFAHYSELRCQQHLRAA